MTADESPAAAVATHPRAEPDVAWLLGLGGLLLLTVIVRLPFLAVPMITDEGGYAYVAHYWAAGSRLYVDLPFDRPQGIFLVYRALLALLGEDVIALRVGAALVAAATAIAIAVLAREQISRRAAWIAGGAFALFATCPSVEGFSANAELFANLPLVLAAHATWKRRWFLAGLFAGIACVVKPSGLSALVLLVAWAAIERAGVRALLAGVAGFALAPAASVLHGISVGFDAYFASLVSDRLLAFSVVTSSADAQRGLFLESLVITSPAWALLAVLAASGAVHVSSSVRRFGVLWLVASFAGMTLGGTWHGHYYMQVLPPLAILAGGAQLGQGSRRVIWSALLVLAFLRFAAVDARYWFEAPDQISLRLYHRPSYLLGQQIADFIAARTTADQTMYVAFAEAHLYYLARRRAAVPQQMYWNQAEHNQRAFAAAMDALARRRPAMVVWSQPPPHWITPQAFQQLLASGYRLAKVFGPIGVFERKP